MAVSGIDRIARAFVDLRKVVLEFEDHGISIVTPDGLQSGLPKLFRHLSASISLESRIFYMHCKEDYRAFEALSNAL